MLVWSSEADRKQKSNNQDLVVTNLHITQLQSKSSGQPLIKKQKPEPKSKPKGKPIKEQQNMKVRRNQESSNGPPVNRRQKPVQRFGTDFNNRLSYPGRRLNDTDV